MGLLDRLGTRKNEPEPQVSAAPVELSFATKALPKFLSLLAADESPVLLDLGPVVGPNIGFFGEQLGCKILIEDVFADLDRHVRAGTLEALPAFLTRRFAHADESVDAVLGWDVIDYLDKASAQALADQVTRVLKPDGVLLAFFTGSATADATYTKFVIQDEVNVKCRPYPAARGKQGALLNRDIIRLFGGLRVSDSFLLKNNLREILFRKPSA